MCCLSQSTDVASVRVMLKMVQCSVICARCSLWLCRDCWRCRSQIKNFGSVINVSVVRFIIRMVHSCSSKMASIHCSRREVRLSGFWTMGSRGLIVVCVDLAYVLIKPLLRPCYTTSISFSMVAYRFSVYLSEHGPYTPPVYCLEEYLDVGISGGCSSFASLHYLWRSLGPFSLPCAQKCP